MQYERGGPHAGLFLFTEQARMARPVRQVRSRKSEMIGSLEQSTMHIRCWNSPTLFLPDVALLAAREGRIPCCSPASCTVATCCCSLRGVCSHCKIV